MISTSGGLATAEKYETPVYRLIESFEASEIREYAPTLIAEVQAPGERKQAINDSFRMLAARIAIRFSRFW